MKNVMIVSIIGCLLTLAGCSDDETQSNAPTSAPQPAAPAPQAAAAPQSTEAPAPEPAAARVKVVNLNDDNFQASIALIFTGIALGHWAPAWLVAPVTNKGKLDSGIVEFHLTRSARRPARRIEDYSKLFPADVDENIQHPRALCAIGRKYGRRRTRPRCRGFAG